MCLRSMGSGHQSTVTLPGPCSSGLPSWNLKIANETKRALQKLYTEAWLLNSSFTVFGKGGYRSTFLQHSRPLVVNHSAQNWGDNSEGSDRDKAHCSILHNANGALSGRIKWDYARCMLVLVFRGKTTLNSRFTLTELLVLLILHGPAIRQFRLT